MPKVILICGKICVGKSTYAEKLRTENKAVLLSVDEIMLAVFGQYAGEKHDEYVRNVQRYIFDKSLEIIGAGVDVILDCGFWTRAHRDYSKEFYGQQGIPCELHLIDIDDEEWRRRIEKRNKAISAGDKNAYFIDENLLKKVEGGYEPPDPDEVDIWVK
ncbi:MAG: ATP-binding protein [Oscillospiraceae bacterium]|nr:ATP-binding protein [Oscillospiraceae bacterium]